MAVNQFGISTTEINTFTHRVIRKTAIDLVSTSAGIYGILSAKGRVQIEDGGAIQTQPLLTQYNETTMTYSGTDKLNVDVQEEFTAYEIDFKQLNTAITLSGKDDNKNSSQHQALSLIKNKVESGLLSHRAKIATMVYGDGTGNQQKDWDGFAAGIANAALFQIYLGIDRVANPFWSAQIFDPGTPTAFSTGSLMTLYMATKTDEEVPDVASTTKAAYAIYWALLTPGERYVDDSIGNLGFSNIAFQGIPIIEDSHCPAGEMWLWNIDHCRIVLQKDKDYKFIDFQEPIDQDAITGHWRTYGNFECRKPPSCGRYRNILNG